MKAFLLVAGLGTRLRPITDETPKCLLTFDGDCLLDLWLDALGDAGADEVLVNLHHLPGAVDAHLARRRRGPVVRTAFEPALLGSGGTLAAHRAWVEGEDFFLACNGDNLTDFDLRVLVEAHRSGGHAATLAVFRAARPHTCGIVAVDGTGRMVGYAEKPDQPAGNLANAGIYAFSPAVLDALDGVPPLDIGYDLLPALVGRAGTVEVGGYLRDVGTPEEYRRAQHEWRARAVR